MSESEPTVVRMAFGDIVKPKVTGFPGEGRFVGIVHPDFYEAMAKQSGQPLSRWDTLFPEWRTKPVYFVQFDEARRRCRLDEYLELHPEATEAQYEERVKPVNVIAYVADDLDGVF